MQHEIPLHVKVYRSLLGDILSGRLKPGEKICGERRLALQYGVSRIVVRQALEALSREQYVMRGRGRRGTHVCTHLPRGRKLNFAGWIAHAEPELSVWRASCRMFESEYPGFQVVNNSSPYRENHSFLVHRLASEQETDLVLISSSWVSFFESIHALEPLEKYLDHELIRSCHYPAADAGPLRVRHTCQVILFRRPLVMYYSRVLMERAGFHPDRPPRTLEELEEMSAAIAGLSDRDNRIFGFLPWVSRGSYSVALHWYIFLLALGGELFDRRGKSLLRSAEAVRALEWYRNLSLLGGAPVLQDSDSRLELFLRHRAGFILSVPYHRGVLEKMGDQFGACIIPFGETARSESVSFNHSLCIPRRSRYKEQAARFAGLLVSRPEAAALFFKSLGMIPGDISLIDPGTLDGPFHPVFYKQLQAARSLPDGFPRFYEALHILSKAVRAVLLERAAARGSLVKAADDIDVLFASHVPITQNYDLE